MTYYFDLSKADFSRDDYYTEQSVRQIPLYQGTPKVVAMSEQEDSNLWPVYDAYGKSNEAVDCKNASEAYDYLQTSLNMIIYERRHDI